MSQPFQLYRLQLIDTQLDSIRNQLNSIEELLSDRQELQAATQSADEAKLQARKALMNLRQAEDIVREQRLKIEQSESTLYSGKMHNPKELQDLQKEVAALKRYLVVLEDRQLECMLAEEEASALSEKCNEQLGDAQDRHKAKNETLTEERESFIKDRARFEGERNAAISDIPQADLTLYEKLRIQKRGIAVSRVENKVCSACGSTLNASLLHAAHSPNQISRCELCGRILYIG